MYCYGGNVCLSINSFSYLSKCVFFLYDYDWSSEYVFVCCCRGLLILHAGLKRYSLNLFWRSKIDLFWNEMYFYCRIWIVLSLDEGSNWFYQVLVVFCLGRLCVSYPQWFELNDLAMAIICNGFDKFLC